MNYLRFLWDCMSDLQQWCVVGILMLIEAIVIWEICGK